MSNVVSGIVRGFRAELMGEILHHRTIDGAGAVASFEMNVKAHKDRALVKLDNLRNDRHEGVDEAVRTINGLCKSEIARATSAGVVEFAEVQ